jgi:hypothetical protein
VPAGLQKLNLEAFDKGFSYGVQLVDRSNQDDATEELPAPMEAES